MGWFGNTETQRSQTLGLSALLRVLGVSTIQKQSAGSA